MKNPLFGELVLLHAPRAQDGALQVQGLAVAQQLHLLLAALAVLEHAEVVHGLIREGRGHRRRNGGGSSSWSGALLGVLLGVLAFASRSSFFNLTLSLQ